MTDTDTRTLQGTVTIARRSDGKIVLRVDDDASRCTILEALLDPRDFGNAVTGLGARPASCTWHTSPLGRRRETAIFVIPLPQMWWTMEGQAQAVARMASHETDGWLGRKDDLFNRHCHIEGNDGGTFANVSFERYVEDRP